MTRVAIIIGTRPEAIKMASVYTACRAADGIEPVLVSTGQHREMLAQVLDVFGLTADIDLGLMSQNQTLAGLTARLFDALDGMLQEVQPDIVLVQGDTTSVMCGAISSFYRNIPVGHVEAGLRTGDLRQPFPEEANRVIASKVTTYHFAPTERSRQNLLNEGVDESAVFVTGNTVIDSLFLEVERQKSDPAIRAAIETHLASLLIDAGAPSGASLSDAPYVLVTGHRRENFGQGFSDICDALGSLARRFPDHRIIYPVHLNPNVREVVHERLDAAKNVLLLPPVDYRHFVALMAGATVVLTDSGGVQEEAPSLGKPVLVMRETTERPEGLDAGTVKLIGTDPSRIESEVAALLEDETLYAKMAMQKNPYGDGHASERIVEVLQTVFASNASRM
jgi:UDP-N-acetylglucosamine 2-epimerase (non-hydrolysing)